MKWDALTLMGRHCVTVNHILKFVIRATNTMRNKTMLCYGIYNTFQELSTRLTLWYVLLWLVRLLLQSLYFMFIMMTSSNGNFLRVTGHLCGNSPATGEFPSQRPVTQSFDVFFILRLNNRLSKQSWGWGFETPSCSLRRHCNDVMVIETIIRRCASEATLRPMWC